MFIIQISFNYQNFLSNFQGDFYNRFVHLIKYYHGDQSKKDEMGGTCATCRQRRDAYRFLMGKPKLKRPLGIFKRRWEGNIKMCLKEIG